MWLDDDTFNTIIKNTPLISIDFIVYNNINDILLGFRNNRPAQGYWFVPGGRVLKDETLDDAFVRLSKAELGAKVQRKQARFQGVYQHFYDDNIFFEKGNHHSTHYIVLAYVIEQDFEIEGSANQQHNRFSWWKVEDVLKVDSVHPYTKDYFSN